LLLIIKKRNPSYQRKKLSLQSRGVVDIDDIRNCASFIRKVMGKIVKPLTDRRRKKERITGEINIEKRKKEKKKKKKKKKKRVKRGFRACKASRCVCICERSRGRR